MLRRGPWPGRVPFGVSISEEARDVELLENGNGALAGQPERRARRLADPVAGILGFAPETVAMWNAVLIGLVIAAAALSALVDFHKWEEWADMAFGLWLLVSPWVLGFAATLAVATWNFVLVGILTIALAAWSLRAHMAPVR